MLHSQKDNSGNVSLLLLEINRIRRDGGTQSRHVPNELIITEYCELMQAGVQFPPVRTWFDGSAYWLSDGFQRCAAAEQAGLDRIRTEVHMGSLEDARWDSFAANSSHGLRRSQRDVETAIKNALSHPKSLQLSNSQIAKHLNVPEPTIRRWRNYLSSPSEEDHVRIAVRNGKQYEINTANIGKVHRAQIQSEMLRKDLREQMAEMKRLGSPDVHRLLNIISNWLYSGASARDCVEAFENVIRGCSSVRSKKAAQDN
jgi:hypothetical protein